MEEGRAGNCGGCQRLICLIICWNYLYLTQKIAEADSEERRQELLLAVRNGSVGTWHHINTISMASMISQTRSSKIPSGSTRRPFWPKTCSDSGRMGCPGLFQAVIN